MNELTPAGRTPTIWKIRQSSISMSMMKLLNSVKIAAALGIMFLAAGCATTKHTETFLTAAGFKLVAATTPKQEQKLHSLPPGKITTVQRNGKTYYVFPDAAHNQIYLGTPYEYQNYRQIVADNKIADSDRIEAELDENGWNDWDSWDAIAFTPN
jgi:hypothetical protein